MQYIQRFNRYINAFVLVIILWCVYCALNAAYNLYTYVYYKKKSEYNIQYLYKLLLFMYKYIYIYLTALNYKYKFYQKIYV